MRTPPANIVIPSCRLCSYMGPTFWVETPLPMACHPLKEHVEQEHPTASAAESMPRLIYGYAAGLTDEILTRVNVRRAQNPYGPHGEGGAPCLPDCGCSV